MNPLAGMYQVDLSLTGATNRSLFIKKRASGFIFDANTTQWEVNLKRYPKGVDSINQKAFNKIQAKRDAPILAKFINEQLQIQ